MHPERYESAASLARAIRAGDRSAEAVVDRALDRIDALNDRTNAVVTRLDEAARERARAADRAVAAGDAIGPLHGVPIVIKDLFDFKAGVRNTFGSVPFAQFVPEESATYVERLEAAGAIVVGKTNVPEFGHKGTTDNELFGPTSTPFALGRNAGGSSGGSAAAVADGLVPFAQGSDAGGSVRIPAAWCGVVGLKPTYGLVGQVSRPDAFVTHTPFTVAGGQLARTVEDVALGLDVMAGPHPRDPLSFPTPDADYREAVRAGIDGWEVAFAPAWGDFPIDPRVDDTVRDAIGALESGGATVDEIDLALGHSHRTLTRVWRRHIAAVQHSVSAGLIDDGVDLLGDHSDDLTPEFRDALAEYGDLTVRRHKRDDHVRTEVFDALRDVLESYDLIVGPSLCVPPVENDPTGSTVGPASIQGEPVDPLIGWCPTYLSNFTGQPAASVPAGTTDDGLPVGLEVVGPRFGDAAVLRAAGVIERVRPWRNAYPGQ